MRSLIVEDDPEAIELGPDAISLDLLQAVYRCSSLPLHTRMPRDNQGERRATIRMRMAPGAG